jgi:hypothetical protein
LRQNGTRDRRGNDQELQRVTYFGENHPLDATPKHIFVADEEYKLGVSDLRHINIVKLGWMKGALI